MKTLRILAAGMLFYISAIMGSIMPGSPNGFVGEAHAQPCQWQYDAVNNVSVATYCANVHIKGNLVVDGSITSNSGTFDYYVDSVAGNDTNSGTSSATPFKSWAPIVALQPSNVSIGAKANSLIRGGLTLGVTPGGTIVTPKPNVTLGVYGVGSAPVSDGSAVIPPSCWTVVGTNTYSCAGLFGNGSTFVGLWECKSSPCTPPEAGGNDTTEQNVASQATVISTAGSYYISNPSANPLTIVYHASDNSDPRVNGYQVTYAASESVDIYGPGAFISGITMRKSSDAGGPCLAGHQYDGGAPTYINYECSQGSKHNMTFPSGIIATNGNFYGAYCPTVCGSFGNMAVAFDNVGQGKANLFTNTKFYSGNTLATSSSTPLYGHANSGSIGTLTVNGGGAYAVGDTNFGAITGTYTGISINAFICSQMKGCFSAAQNATVTNSQAYSTVASNTQFSSSVNGVIVSFTNTKVCAANDAVGLMNFPQATLNLSNVTGYVLSPSSAAATVTDNGGGGTILTVNNSLFDSNIAGAFSYAMLGASGNTFAGDNNMYHGPASTSGNYRINSTTYTTLTTWQIAVSPADANSVVGGNGSSACVLP